MTWNDVLKTLKTIKKNCLLNNVTNFSARKKNYKLDEMGCGRYS